MYNLSSSIQADKLKRELETQNKEKKALEARVNEAEKKVQELSLKLENVSYLYGIKPNMLWLCFHAFPPFLFPVNTVFHWLTTLQKTQFLFSLCLLKVCISFAVFKRYCVSMSRKYVDTILLMEF
jgi:hypothetical protein